MNKILGYILKGIKYFILFIFFLIGLILFLDDLNKLLRGR